MQLPNPQHDKHGAELSTSQWLEASVLENRAYTLLRTQTGNKEAHFGSVAEARQILLHGMTVSSHDGLPGIRRLRKFYHLAVAERKLGSKQGLDTGEMLKHLDQAEAYMDKAIGLDMLPELVGAREQMALEQHILGGLRAKLEFRMQVRNRGSTCRLLSDAIAGIKRALKDLEKVDTVKHGKNTEFAREWIDYFRKLHTRWSIR